MDPATETESPSAAKPLLVDAGNAVDLDGEASVEEVGQADGAVAVFPALVEGVHIADMGEAAVDSWRNERSDCTWRDLGYRRSHSGGQEVAG